MPSLQGRLPSLIAGAIALAMLLYGPIPQLQNYHGFVDVRFICGAPNGANVWSNLAFAIAGLWGMAALWARRGDPALQASWLGHTLFAASLVLTAAGSAYYHWAPDNARLIWDRLPISLACAALLAAFHAETHDRSPRWLLAALMAFAVAGIASWWITDQRGSDDLRLYLYLQLLPIVLVPLWQWIAGAPRRDRVLFGLTIALYAVAKGAELADRPIYEATGFVSGHTVKHLLAAAGGAVIVFMRARPAATRAEAIGSARAGPPNPR